MAKSKKGNRFPIALLCSVCGAQNYITEKNKINLSEKLKLTKYCNWCRKKTDHKETTKLK